MKAQNPSTNAQNMRTEIRSDEPEGTGEHGPSLAEIRQREFEIHIERGGIHGCDLDDSCLSGCFRSPPALAVQAPAKPKIAWFAEATR